MTPLSGLRVVVTRASHQAEELAEPLRQAGAGVILCPAIAIAPPDRPDDLAAAAARANEFDWIIFGSANAVTAFRAQLGEDLSVLAAKIAVIGSSTKQFAEAAGFKVELVPERYVAESLIEAFGDLPLGGKNILVPRAAVTRDVVPFELRKLGAAVTVVEAYRNIVPPQLHKQAKTVFSAPLPDWILFASSSAVDNLVPITGTVLLEQMSVASIGPITTASLRKHGLRPRVEAAEHTVNGLVAALGSSVRGERSGP